MPEIGPMSYAEIGPILGQYRLAIWEECISNNTVKPLHYAIGLTFVSLCESLSNCSTKLLDPANPKAPGCFPQSDRKHSSKASNRGAIMRVRKRPRPLVVAPPCRYIRYQILTDSLISEL